MQRAYDVQTSESDWRTTWRRQRRHACPRFTNAPRYFIHDSAPFPNGPLHLGHVRTYVLGDMTARYQRQLGKAVLYHTGFDAFGLPIELEAGRLGVSPQELVDDCTGTMRDQLERLGISYDWEQVPTTSHPACYRWTQWLFLEMLDAGLIEQTTAEVAWCGGCKTSLARSQVERGTCWRCGRAVTSRSLPQWVVRISRYAPKLLASLDDLDQWSGRARDMLRAILRGDAEREPGRSARGLDWLVSRQRAWGTPIPVIHCVRCGPVGVPRNQLPIRLPDELDWTAPVVRLDSVQSFVEARCPRCGRSARRETDTLDCFFDDIWCFLQALALDGDPPGILPANFSGWLPVDRCQSGVDTIYYFHLYRFLGQFLHERGIVEHPELIRSFHGNELVLRNWGAK